MTLLEALRAVAAQMRPRSRQAGGRYVRFDGPARTLGYADDGLHVRASFAAACAAQVAFDMDALLPSLRQAAEVLDVSREPGTEGLHFVLRTEGGGTTRVRVPSLPLRSAPAPAVPPPGTPFLALPRGPQIASVLHALGDGDPDMPHFAYVRLCAFGAAASDMARIAVVAQQAPWDGLVDGRLFSRWPKDQAAFGAGTDAGVHLVVGAQARFAPYRPGTREAMVARLGADAPWRGARVVVSRLALLRAARQCAASRPGAVRLELSPAGVRMVALAQGDGGVRTACVVPGALGAGGAGTLVVLGRYLAEAASAAKTPAVRLGWTGADDPLLLAGGPLCCGIWPYYPDG